MCSLGRPTEHNTASDTRFPGLARLPATSLGAPILDPPTKIPGSRSGMTAQTILLLRQQLRDGACLVPWEVRRASQPARSGQQQNQPKLTSLLTWRSPEFIKFLCLGMARDVPPDGLRLVPNAFPLRLPCGFLRDVTQQRRQTDVARPRLGFQLLANVVVESDGDRGGHVETCVVSLLLRKRSLPQIQVADRLKH